MKEYTTVTRKNREVSDEDWIKAMLNKAPYAAIAFSKDNQPFLNINLFIYSEDEHCIYFHTAGRGQTKEVVMANEKVCFSVFEMGRLLPGKNATDFSSEYKSVIVFGTVHIIEDQTLASRILGQYLIKYSPHLKMGEDFTPYTADDVKRTTVYKITIKEWSGKKNSQPIDFPGAFQYRP
jgi:nitroimidazol reductase NimA-like FMN-containing flavoprotein (pyridoxamine 5'-phosphate oxidase superfamily)